MAQSAGVAWVKIRPDFSDFGREVTKGVGDSLAKVGQKISSFGGTLTKTITLPLLAAAGAAGGWGLKVAASAEQSKIAFKTLLPVGADVVGFMTELADFAKKTPFDVQTVNDMAVGLIGVGMAAEDVLPLLTGMGDAVAGFGGGAAQVDAVNYQMKQVIGSGRAYTADINAISNSVPTIWQEVAAQMGVTVGEAREMASEGKITSDVLVAAFEAPVGPLANLTGMMDAQAGTLAGVWGNFTETLGVELGNAITPLLPQIKQALTDLGAALGPALAAAAPVFTQILQALTPLIGKIAELLTWFANLSEGQQQFIIKAGLGAAALGPVLVVFGKFVSAVGSIIKAVSGIASVAKGIGTFVKVVMAIGRIYGVVGVLIKVGMAVKTFVQVIIVSMRILSAGLLTNPITLIIIAIVAAIAAAVFLIVKYWDQIKAAFMAAWDFIQPILMAIWNVIVTVFTTIWNIVKGVFDALVAAFQAVWEAIEPIWNTFWALLTLPIRIWWTVISAILQLAWAGIKWVFETVKDFVVGVWEWLWDKVSAIFNAWWSAIKAVYTAVWDFISGIFTKIKDAVVAAWTFLWDKVKAVWDAVYGWIKPKFDAVKDFIVDTFNSVKDKVKAVWDSIVDIIRKAVDAVKGVGEGIWTGLKGVINTGIKLLNSAIGGFNKLIGAVNKVPGVNVPTIPTIPLLAKGGIVTRPTLAVAGEAGPEAVIPLSKLDTYFDAASGKKQDIYLAVHIGDEEITRMIERVYREESDDLARTLVGGRRI